MNNETHRKFRVVLVEDHPMFREQLAQLIDKEPGMNVCGQTDNIQDAFNLIECSQPDVAIVDLTLKGAGGLELIKNLKAKEINIPVLVLSMHDEALYAERVLKAGARGYITKNEASMEVMTAIHAVLRGEIYLPARIASRILESVSVGQLSHAVLVLASNRDTDDNPRSDLRRIAGQRYHAGTNRYAEYRKYRGRMQGRY